MWPWLCDDVWLYGYMDMDLVLVINEPIFELCVPTGLSSDFYDFPIILLLNVPVPSILVVKTQRQKLLFEVGN